MYYELLESTWLFLELLCRVKGKAALEKNIYWDERSWQNKHFKKKKKKKTDEKYESFRDMTIS